MLSRNFAKLGDTGIRRLVILQGFVTISELIPVNIVDLDTDVKRWLVSQGFDVATVRITPNNYFGREAAITIELNVDTAYTAEQARQNATAVLQNITRWFVTSFKIFTNVRLSVSRELQPNQGIITPNQNTGSNTLPDNPSDKDSSGLDAFLKGAGISAPLAIVAAGVVLLVVFRK